MDVTTFDKDGKKYIRVYVSSSLFKQNIPATERTFWQHANGCNGNIFVGENAICYCDKCNTRSHIRNWQVICDNHSSSANGQVNNEESWKRLSVSNCAAMAGDMVKEGGISWLKSFLASLSSYTSDDDSKLVMQPYTEFQVEEEPSDPQQVGTDTFEVSGEEFQEQPETIDQTGNRIPEPEVAAPEEDKVYQESTGTADDERDDGVEIDLSSFDENLFFERYSKKNNN